MFNLFAIVGCGEAHSPGAKVVRLNFANLAPNRWVKFPWSFRLRRELPSARFAATETAARLH